MTNEPTNTPLRMYLPFEKRKPDHQYAKALKDILKKGVWTGSGTGNRTKTRTGIQMRFLVENGAPLITERNLAPVRRKDPTIWQQAIGEILGFINGARTQEKLSEFGCKWWRHWVTEEKCSKRGLPMGDLGLGSYGHSFANHETAHEDFDQIGGVLLQMKERPELKTHVITPWQPQFVLRTSKHQQKVVVCPCHGWMHFTIHEKGLTLHMFQRSGDMPVGVPNNMIQYFALLLGVASYLGIEPYEYVHTVSDAHIYEDQIPLVKKLLKVKPVAFPQLILNETGTYPKDLRYTDFELQEYKPASEIQFPVAV